MFPWLLSGLLKTAKLTEEQRKAKSIRREIAKTYKTQPYLTGSMALGTNVPGHVDYDYGIVSQNLKRFKELAAQLESGATPSPYNKPNTDYRVFQAQIQGEPVDIALVYGRKGAEHRSATRRVAKTLSPEEKASIAKRKKELKESWFFPKYRTKKYKRELDKQLGIPRFGRQTLEKKALAPRPGELSRADVYGHRTANLEPILRSGRILAASEAKRRGLLKSYEVDDPTSRERTEELPDKLRSEVFSTKGLLPSTSTYGRYGVMFRSRKAEPSRYLNLIPEEHVIPKEVKSKLTFVVPDEEKAKWEAEHPDKQIVGESEVPEKKRLSEKSYIAPLSRLLRIPKLTQEKE